VSVKVRLSILGLLDAGGEVFWVVPLSFVGVLVEFSDSVGSKAISVARLLDVGGLVFEWVGCGRVCSRVVVGDSIGESVGPGLLVLGTNCLSNTFSPDVSAGPLRGAAGRVGSTVERLPAPTRCALARRSSMFCVSTSPEILACALARAALPGPDHPIRSFMNSIERLIMFCRLCISSSDWCAKEKECSDSDGNRDRSSVNDGETGPGDMGILCPCASSIVLIDVDLARPTDGLREETAEGSVGVRIGWCC
jgi:hypothetical protein